MIVNPIKNADGTIKTNVQICREAYGIFKSMSEGDDTMTDAQKEKYEDAYHRIMNDPTTEREVMAWLKQIAEIEDDAAAQRMIERTLLPVLTRK